MTIAEIKESRGKVVSSSSWGIVIATGEICSHCDGGQIVNDIVHDDGMTVMCWDCGVEIGD